MKQKAIRTTNTTVLHTRLSCKLRAQERGPDGGLSPLEALRTAWFYQVGDNIGTGVCCSFLCIAEFCRYGSGFSAFPWSWESLLHIQRLSS